MVLILFTFSSNLRAEAQLNITQTLNPNSVTIGESSTLSLSINNKDKNAITIYSISIKNPPWLRDEILETPVGVGTNRIFYRDLQVNIPENVSAATYVVETLVNSSLAESIARTDLKIERLQSIPLSGDVPLSILVIVFSGAITYILIVYIIRRKFEHDYLALSLYSVGFGFLDWFVARQLHFVGLIETIHNEPLGILWLFLVSSIIGLTIAGAIKVYQYVQAWAIARGIKLITIKMRQTKGFTEDPRPVWRYIIEEELAFVKDNLGKKYAVTLRVHVNEHINFKRSIEGIYYLNEPEKPYDLFLAPKHITACDNRDDIIRILKSNSNAIIREELNENESYLNTMKKYMNIEASPTEIANKIIAKLEDDKFSSNFFKTLEEIDFSKFVKQVAEALRKTNVSTALEYNDASIYVPGDNIAGIEIIKYESFHALSFKETEEVNIFPKVYKKDELVYIKKSLFEENKSRTVSISYCISKLIPIGIILSVIGMAVIIHLFGWRP
jgi:hypothetical protein